MVANKRQKQNLLVIGELNMDLILDKVESFPEPEKEKIAEDMSLTLGSSSAIFAANSARLGLPTSFCGMVGADDFGKRIIKELKNFGVNTSAVMRSDIHETGLTAIIRHAGDRAMVTYPGAMAHFTMDDIPADVFQKAQHLHMSSIFLQPGIKRDLFEIIEKAKSHGMTISVDPQWDPSEKWDLDIDKLLQTIDFFLPNEAEFLHLTSSSSVNNSLLKITDEKYGAIIVKQSVKGATFLRGESVITVPAFTNDAPVDAVGAGDSFNAGFIYRLLAGDSVEKCVRFGNLTGAVSTTQAGGTAAITSLKEVQKIATDKFSIKDFDEITR